MPETRTAHLPVLLVDDDKTVCSMAALTLKEAGIKNVHCISDSRQVLPFLQEHGVSLILLDLLMPHLTGQELLEIIRRDYPDVQVIVISGSNELNLAVECMKMGAIDYQAKPLEANRLIASVKNALRLSSMQGELLSLKKRMLGDLLVHSSAFDSIKTSSGKMRALFQYAEVIAVTPQPILITGETGVGKELMARAVHHLSGLRGAFVSVNVAGLDDTTFSDTLFGHKKGAFTGADQAREGLIASASGGTLFLDEIGDLEERSQIKLLRLLQEGEYYQVGSDALKRTTARIIAVTNKELSEQVAAKHFRMDLYYRLRTHEIHIPPLRERYEDIPLLLDLFLHEAALMYHKKAPKVSFDVFSNLLRWSFPGNIRELKAMVHDAVARNNGEELTAQSFVGINWNDNNIPADYSSVVVNSEASHPIYSKFGCFPTLTEMEEYHIQEALRRTSGNYNMAAAMLGITRQTINNRKKKFSSTKV